MRNFIIVAAIVALIFIAAAILSGLGYGPVAGLPKWTITGKVVDSSSSPLADVEIDVTAGARTTVLNHLVGRGPRVQRQNFASASDGSFAFTCEGHRLLVELKRPGTIPKTFLFLKKGRRSHSKLGSAYDCLPESKEAATAT